MWIAISLMSIASLICAYILYDTKHDRRQVTMRVAIIFELLSLISAIRQLRDRCHQHLKDGGSGIQFNSIEQHALRVNAQSLALTTILPPVQRTMMRMLIHRLNTLQREWLTMTPARCQSAHGNAIRHAFYIADELINHLLADYDDPALLQHYDQVWQLTVDSLDTLTLFRQRIDMASTSAQLLRMPAQQLRKRLNKLNTLNRCDDNDAAQVTSALNAIGSSSVVDSEALYDLCNHVSTLIMSAFKFELEQIAIALNVPTDHLTIDNCSALYAIQPRQF